MRHREGGFILGVARRMMMLAMRGDGRPNASVVLKVHVRLATGA